MNAFDNIEIDTDSFAWRDLIDQDVWVSFTPVFGSLTVIGATSYTGRMRFVGRQGYFQVKFSAATSVASVDGTTYLQLPFTAIGLAAQCQLVNLTSKVEVAGARVIVSESKLYLPTIVATSNVFAIAGWSEV